MNLILLIFVAMPQNYINFIMKGKYEEAVKYCDEMIDKGKHVYKWELEKGDIYLDKIEDYEKAAEVYTDLIENHKKKEGWLYYRRALAYEKSEDYLTAAKSYEIVATQYRKPPLDSFSLSGVERCFKKNYQDFVASVDGYKITRLELDEQLAKAGPFAKKDARAVLDQIILERLIYVNALQRGMAKTDFYQEKIGARKRALLLEELKAVEVLAKAQPSEKEMRKYHEKNKKDYVLRAEIRGKEIVVESDSLAQFLLDSLKKSVESFDTLAKLYSTAPTAKNGGNMGIVYEGVKTESIERQLFKAKLNTLTKIIPFDEKFGIYIVSERKPKRYRKYEEVKRQIEATLKAEKTKKFEEKLIKDLKKKARIEIFAEIASDTTTPPEEQVAAIVNGRSIVKTEIMKRNESQPHFARVDLTKPEEFEKLLNTMIDEELKLERVERKKYFLNDGYVTKMQIGVKRILENTLYNKVVLESASVDPQDVENYYKEHKEEFRVPETIHGQEIIVDSLDLAKAIRKFLIKNTDKFDSLAQEHSIAPSGKQGGAPGMIRRGVRHKNFDDIVFKMKVGSISKIFSENDSTYTIIKLTEHNPAKYRPFEDVKKSIETNLLRKKYKEIADGFLAEIREKADIKIFLSEPGEEKQPEEGVEKEEEKVNDVKEQP
jgi:peptidyl-prolyl cis-trans isomerase C